MKWSFNMKKIVVIFTILISTFSHASTGAITVNSFFDGFSNHKQNTHESSTILLVGNISDEANSIANIDLNYYEAPDCSGGIMGSVRIFDKRAPVIVKHKTLLKMLGATVYNAGKQHMGEENMYKVHSIAVRLGTHFSNSNLEQLYFLDPEQIKFSKSYCVKSVICEDEVCQSTEHFIPYTALMLYKNGEDVSGNIPSKTQDKISELAASMSHYYSHDDRVKED
jgi:hypothetical protein